jgi:creatinine amidohydrolase/Fe(II)-dependent formamide hydrolase-like protein
MMQVAGGQVDTVRFDAVTYEEIGRCAREGYLVLIPTGCTEQQGPHLPVGVEPGERLWEASVEAVVAILDEIAGTEGGAR